MADRPRHGWGGARRSAWRIGREQVSLLVVQRGGDHVGVGLEGVQNLARVVRISEREGRGRVRGQDVRAGDERLREKPPKADDIVRDEYSAHEQEDRRAREHHGRDELPPNGGSWGFHSFTRTGPTISDCRSSLELIVSLAALAAARLIASRRRFSAMTKPMIPERTANSL